MGIFGSGGPAYSLVEASKTLLSIVGDVVQTTAVHGMIAGQFVYFSALDIAGDTFGVALVVSITNTTTFVIDRLDYTGATLGTMDIFRGGSFAKLEFEAIQNDTIIHTSVLTGHKNTIHLGNYSRAIIDTHLLKVPISIRDDVARIYYADNGQLVYLKPHVDGEYIEDELGAKVQFLLTVEFNYLSSVDFRDLATLTFTALDYTDIEDNIL